MRPAQTLNINRLFFIKQSLILQKLY